MLLYHRSLKIERVLLRRHHNIAHISYSTHKQIGAKGVMGAVEIGADAPLEILSFAYVNHRPLGVIVHIHSGGVGEDGYLLLKGG